jgi:hypothetical protein
MPDVSATAPMGAAAGVVLGAIVAAALVVGNEREPTSAEPSQGHHP